MKFEKIIGGGGGLLKPRKKEMFPSFILNLRVHAILGAICLLYLRYNCDAFLQYVVIIVVGTGLLFMVIFHLGVKEPHRPCTFDIASVGSKRSALSWTKWFKEVQFYQVEKLLMNNILL